MPDRVSLDELRIAIRVYPSAQVDDALLAEIEQTRQAAVKFLNHQVMRHHRLRGAGAEITVEH